MSFRIIRGSDKDAMEKGDDDKTHVRVAESLRLVTAFAKIREQSDRHTVIDLAEWLGN